MCDGLASILPQYKDFHGCSAGTNQVQTENIVVPLRRRGEVNNRHLEPL